MHFKLSVEDAVPVATAFAFAVGVVYPWNAKLGYLTPGLPVKYAAAASKSRFSFFYRRRLRGVSPCPPRRRRDPPPPVSTECPRRYPMHYVPEVLMFGLTVAGVAAMM